VSTCLTSSTPSRERYTYVHHKRGVNIRGRQPYITLPDPLSLGTRREEGERVCRARSLSRLPQRYVHENSKHTRLLGLGLLVLVQMTFDDYRMSLGHFLYTTHFVDTLTPPLLFDTPPLCVHGVRTVSSRVRSPSEP